MEIIDSHCHLFLEEFQAGPRGEPEIEPGIELRCVLERAVEAGVVAIVNVALDVETTLTVLDMAAERPWLSPTAGWHPGGVERLEEGDLQRLADLAAKPEVVAFGEIGLDYHRGPRTAALQKRALSGLLEAAKSARKPVIIHCREALDDLIEILAPVRPFLPGVVFHCFSGAARDVERLKDLDCHLSFTGPITFPKAEESRLALAATPPDRLMIETDAPYLAPVPHRGRRNEPSYLTGHLKTVSEVLGLSLEEAAALTTANARRFFGLPGPS